MSDNDSNEAGFFREVLQSQVDAVRCRRCGCDTVVNKAYAKYLVDGMIDSCRQCRNAEQG